MRYLLQLFLQLEYTHHKEVAGPPIETAEPCHTEVLARAYKRLACVVRRQHDVLHGGEERLAEHASLPLHL